MLHLIAQSKNSITSYTDAMQFLATDLQNFQTDGYKGIEFSFQNLFTATLNRANPRTGESQTSIAPGISLVPQGIDFTQGALVDGDALNVAIQGDSFYMIGRPGDQTRYTRRSDFKFNSDGSLIDSIGRGIFAYKIDHNGKADKQNLTPIKIDPNQYTLMDIGFEDDGFLYSNFRARKYARDNDQVVPPGEKLFQMALANFSNPAGLVLDAGGSFKPTPQSGKPVAYGVSGETSFGFVRGGYLEGSNVDAAAASITAVQLQRGYNAVQSSFSIISRLLQDFMRAVTQ